MLNSSCLRNCSCLKAHRNKLYLKGGREIYWKNIISLVIRQQEPQDSTKATVWFMHV